MKPKVSIILPTYNEAANIIPLIDAIRQLVLESYEIIVVDDNSPDRTSQKVNNYIKEHQAAAKNVRIITRLQDHGLTKSIQQGIDASTGESIVWLDCDFSHPVEVIPQLCKGLTDPDVDIVVASRFVPGGHQKTVNAHESQIAVLLSTAMNRFIAMLFDMDFHDFTSGFIAIRRETIQSLPLQGDYGEYFIDLIVRAHRKKYIIKEIPYIPVARKAGESKTAPNLRTLIKRGVQYGRTVFSLLV